MTNPTTDDDHDAQMGAAPPPERGSGRVHRRVNALVGLLRRSVIHRSDSHRQTHTPLSPFEIRAHSRALAAGPVQWGNLASTAHLEEVAEVLTVNWSEVQTGMATHRTSCPTDGSADCSGPCRITTTRSRWRAERRVDLATAETLTELLVEVMRNCPVPVVCDLARCRSSTPPATAPC